MSTRVDGSESGRAGGDSGGWRAKYCLPGSRFPRTSGETAAPHTSSRTTASASSRPRRVSTSRSPSRTARPRATTSSTRSGGDQRRAAGRRAGGPRGAPARSRGSLVEHLAVLGRRLAGGDAGGVRAGVLDVPPPLPRDVRVRARADAPPARAGPVELVVPAARGLVARPVGDLVPLQPGGREARRRPGRTCRPGRRRRASAITPVRTWRARRVPSSTIREYAETWSGSQASAGVDARPASRRGDSPGVP